MKFLIIFFISLLTQDLFSQSLVRKKKEDKNVVTIYNNELKRIEKEYNINSPFGFIKTVVRNGKNEFDETTRVIEMKKGEVVDYLIESRYLTSDEEVINNSSPMKKINKSFYLNGTTYYQNNKAIACVFRSTKFDTSILIKFLFDDPINYYGRQDDNCYVESYIVLSSWWYYSSTILSKESLIDYMKKNFNKQE